MVNLNYDFHIHSCLSPCGDDDMTPANIVGMAALKGLDVIAVTDHNSCKNCPPVLKLAEEYGVLAIPGMEICTMEEVHVVCLFSELKDALLFDEYVDGKMPAVMNNEVIFGKQQIYDEADNELGRVEKLLINAVNISFDELFDLMEQYHGIMIPAHIDKAANSLLSNLGFIPPDSRFSCVEVKDLKKLHELQRNHPYLKKCKVISDSDAHYLEDIQEPIYSIYAKDRTVKDILEALTGYIA